MNEKILIIIPAYNEEKSILRVYNGIINYNKEKNTSYDVIIINDGSTDSTKQICQQNNIPVINLVQNLGIGGAVQTGYKYAYENNYDYAIQYDGDGQHEVSCVKDILEPLRNKEADMCVGSRFIDKESSEFKSSTARRIGIKIISNLIRITTGKRIFDVTSGFRAVNKRIIKHFAYTYPLEYPEPVTNADLLKKNIKVIEVPVQMHERETGQSSIHTWKNVYFMINIFLSILVVVFRGNK